MLAFVLGVIAAPAFVLAVFAIALGLNPVPAAAWGAIAGMGALTVLAVAILRSG